MFSSRAQWQSQVNRLTLARREHRGEILDLTETNPTRAGLSYPLDALADAMAAGARERYDPDPRGLLVARESLATVLRCDPTDLILTASTSEAYSYLFKLLCDPGDHVLTATPGYPLLEHLASFELAVQDHFAMEFHRRWEIDADRVRASVHERTRAIVVVNPNNPTGSFVTAREQDALAAIGIPLISDEVFLDYPLDGAGTTVARDDINTFTLGGLSKAAGLPHFKLGWIRANGPDKAKSLEALELIADNFLSVATPVQAALPRILELAPTIRAAIQSRTRANLAAARQSFGAIRSSDLLPVEGGWSAVIRFPRLRSDEEIALELLAEGVVVQPGYFFDFPSDGFLVVSLLTDERTFQRGIEKVAARLGTLA